MIQHARLAALLPHAGAMVLLDAIVSWDATMLSARSRSHLDAANPLRRGGMLPAVCGIEYGLQAAALHGAMRAGGVAQPAGMVARLRDAAFHVVRLDDPALGTLRIEARLARAEAGGLLYALTVQGERGQPVVEARAAIALPHAPVV